MKYIFLLVLITLTQVNKYEEFIEVFPEIRYDEYGNYLTRNLNWKTVQDLRKDFKLIPDDQSYVFLCDEDSSKFYFEYDRYHMEEGYFIERARYNYDHYAILKMERENFSIFLYSRFDKWADRFLLRSFDNSGGLVDELVVNEEIRSYTSASLDRFSYSLINSDSIKVFNYKDAENPNQEDEKPPLVTKVVIENYAIDSLGRFNRVDVDSVLLSKPMRAYSKFDIEPEPDDPVYKYWTLW
jgi:hypothetical protein